MRKRMKFIFFVGSLLALMTASSSFSFDFSELEDAVVEHTLDNGLKIIILPRHQAPVASFVTIANVGGVDYEIGASGLAHMFEHMAFKGTMSLGSKNIKKELKAMAVEDSVFYELRAERNKGRLTDSTRLAELEQAYDDARDAAYEYVEPNAYGQTIDRAGGTGLNAYTSYDQTVYHYSLPSNKVELWMALESERFFKPVLREMYRERDVVAEERRMRTESTPLGKMMEEFFITAFHAHPYGVSIVGHMSDIQNYTRDAAKAYFEKYYGPSNLTVVIVGDVEPKDVFKLAKKYWGRISTRPAPERITVIEPEQRGERRVVLEDPSQPLYWAGWHIPEGMHPDRPAIDGMLDYLGQGRTSLLYKNLVKEKKIAMQAQAFSGWPGNKYPTMASVIAVPTQGHSNQECEDEVFAEIERLKEKLLTSEEVEHIKARAKAGFINVLENNMGLAEQLAIYQQIWGDWRKIFNELDRINTVTPEEIQRVAKEYFTEKNRTVVMMNTVES